MEQCLIRVRPLTFPMSRVIVLRAAEGREQNYQAPLAVCGLPKVKPQRVIRHCVTERRTQRIHHNLSDRNEGVKRKQFIGAHPARQGGIAVKDAVFVSKHERFGTKCQKAIIC